jgi:hypothetical protein
LLARWEGRIGERGLWVRVDVSRLDPVEAATDRAWSRRLWAETHGSSQVREARLRFWRDGEARRAESAVQWGGGEVDPAWSLVRFQEQPDGVLYLRLVVGGVPSAADRARLRAAFVDGPLGAPPGFGP